MDELRSTQPAPPDPPAAPAPDPLAMVRSRAYVVLLLLAGNSGHSPADGLKTGGTPAPIELPGVFLAALATLNLGAVLGPEAP